jgi:hypothetical protein
MIFNTVNLDWLTCIQILEAPLQVEKWFSLINIQKSSSLKGIMPTNASTPLYQIG